MARRAMREMKVSRDIFKILAGKTKMATWLLMERENMNTSDIRALKYLAEICDIMTDPDSFNRKVYDCSHRQFDETKMQGDEMVIHESIFYYPSNITMEALRLIMKRDSLSTSDTQAVKLLIEAYEIMKDPVGYSRQFQ